MDLIHLFVSNVLLDVIYAHEIEFCQKPVRVDPVFYDINAYISWAAGQLETLTAAHLVSLFPADATLEQYYDTCARLRRDPSFVQQTKQDLETIFPFLQRTKNPRNVVFKYLELLETLHDAEPAPPAPAGDPAALETCKKLGIMLKTADDPAALIEQFRAGQIAAESLSLAGLRQFVRARDPRAVVSRLNRARLLELFNSLREQVNE